MDYKNKYIKYKNKYLKLKNLVGGNYLIPLNNCSLPIDKENISEEERNKIYSGIIQNSLISVDLQNKYSYENITDEIILKCHNKLLCSDIWEISNNELFLKKDSILVTASENSEIIKRTNNLLYLLPSIQSFKDFRYQYFNLKGMPINDKGPWANKSEIDNSKFFHLFKVKKNIKIIPFTFYGTWWGSPKLNEDSTKIINYNTFDIINENYSKFLEEEKSRILTELEQQKKPLELMKDNLTEEIYQLALDNLEKRNPNQKDYFKNDLLDSMYYDSKFPKLDKSEELKTKWLKEFEKYYMEFLKKKKQNKYINYGNSRTPLEVKDFTEDVFNDYNNSDYSGMSNSREIIIFNWKKDLVFYRKYNKEIDLINECE